MKISIITASYNCRPWIGDCIRSVQSQNYPNYEHLILDDHSTDRSIAKIEAMARRDSNLKIVSSRNKLYCGGAYNVLAQEATGDIVCVIDSDDVICNRAMIKIAKLYEDNPDVGWIYTNFWICNVILKKTKEGFSRHPGEKSLLEDGRHCFSHWRTYRREAVGGASIFKPGLLAAVDKYMGYRLEELAIGGFKDEKLYKYRTTPGGLSYTGKPAWRKMKRRFEKKRERKGIKAYPIKVL